jgi:hypothetical protein
VWQRALRKAVAGRVVVEFVSAFFLCSYPQEAQENTSHDLHSKWLAKSFNQTAAQKMISFKQIRAAVLCSVSRIR